MQEKYLHNGIELKLRLNPTSLSFVSWWAKMGSHPVIVKIDVATLSLRHAQLLPAITKDTESDYRQA